MTDTELILEALEYLECEIRERMQEASAYADATGDDSDYNIQKEKLEQIKRLGWEYALRSMSG